jgi:hypothetical protein
VHRQDRLGFGAIEGTLSHVVRVIATNLASIHRVRSLRGRYAQNPAR